jgi:hypothetical protein
MRTALPVIEIDPRLIEGAVEGTLRERPDHPYWREREALYTPGDAEERDRAFLALGRATFETLGLGQPLVVALEEQALLCRSLVLVRVVQARSVREEGADYLSVSSPGPRAIVRFLPETLLDAERLLRFLRHELFHLADMIDPAFGYDPELPDCDGSAARRRELIVRYRALWDATIDGRLARRGRAPSAAQERRRREVEAAFAVLGERAGTVFDRWWSEASPRHERMLACALDPQQGEASAERAGRSSLVCPLCRFPWVAAAGFDPVVSAAVAAEIQLDFPAWTPAAGVCPRCVELYRSRPLSRAAEAALPGIRASAVDSPAHAG